MKKNNLFYVIIFSGLCISGLSQAQGWFFEEKKEFEDKPALSAVEWWALQGAKGMGGGLGAGAGLVTGSAAGELGGKGVIAFEEWRESLEFRDPGTAEQTGRYFAVPPAIAAGGYAGYKGGEWAAIHALAKLHGVSPRIEAVSQFYDINAPLYRALLRAAELKNQEELLAAINNLYAQRFGKNWQERLQKLFKKYRRKSKKLVKEGSFALEGDERDFVRMVELGAALENLYSGTKLIYNALGKPNKEAAVGFAKDLYTDLGLL